MGDGSGYAQAGATLAVTGMELAFAESQANKAAAREKALKKEMSDLKRQPIVNPYEDGF